MKCKVYLFQNRRPTCHADHAHKKGMKLRIEKVILEVRMVFGVSVTPQQNKEQLILLGGRKAD